MIKATSRLSLLELTSRTLGYYAAEHLTARKLYSLGARLYSTPSRTAACELRKEINIMRALPEVWEGASSYEQTYPTSRAPFFEVNMQKLLDRYDCFFVDVFGTYKDETGIWPGAKAVLQQIKASGKIFIVVSNTTDFSPVENQQQLSAAGINIGLDQIVTAGQTLRRVFRDLGLAEQRILNIGNQISADYLKQANTQPVELNEIGSSYQAICISFLDSPFPPEIQNALKKIAEEKGIPIILANNDRFLPMQSGIRENWGYRLAKDLSKKSGNRIISIGKPEPRIYEEAMRRLASYHPRKILCVGDTLWTDIQGANRFQEIRSDIQIDSLLLLSGTERRLHHFPELLETYMKTTGDFPTFILPGLELQ